MELIFYFLSFMALLGIGIFVLGRIIESLTKAQGYSTQVMSLKHVGGIPYLDKGVGVRIGVRETELDINGTHTLSLDRVKSVQLLQEEELVDKQKSVIKRAVAAGILLGPLGSIIGGMSGIGTKQEKEIREFLSIDFLDKDGIEETAIFLLTPSSKPDIKSFVKDVNEKVQYLPEEIIKPNVINPYKI